MPLWRTTSLEDANHPRQRRSVAIDHANLAASGVACARLGVVGDHVGQRIDLAE
jgi:hypothetical protein